MKKITKNKLFKNYISLVIPLFIIEVLFRIFLAMPFFDWALFRIFIGCNILALFASFLENMVSDKVGSVLSIFILLASTIYAIMQAGFENYIGVYISLGTSSQLGAVTEYIRDYFDSFDSKFYLMAIPFILFCFYKITIEHKLFKNYYKENKSKFVLRNNKKECLISICIIGILGCIYYSTLHLSFMQNELQIESTKSLFRNPTNPNISVNQFGVSTFGMLDIKTTIIKPNNTEYEILEKKEEKEITDYSRVFDDTLWEELQSKTVDENYRTLNTYFMNQEITNKNEYTGLFEGKNLLVIMLESVNEIFINPEYYPTFYKLYTEGLHFTNSYSPRNSCSTGNNEMSGMISLYSIYRTCTVNNYRSNEYPESIFHLFRKAGYETSSYHNYTEKYYYRNTIHQNMGSGTYYGVTDLGIDYNEAYEEWPSDILLMERAMERIDTDNPFMAWITTVTSHQPYYTDSEFGLKHIDLFDDTEYSLNLKRYMSKLKELDLALARLLELLEEKGILEDTVLVLYGDHYPYGLNKNVINEALNYDVNEYNNVEKTPFVIYNSGVEGQSFSEYTSYMNILPTVANLFNLDYDPRLYAGHDVFSEEYHNDNYVVLADGSWEDEVAYYNATSGKIEYKGEITYSNEEIVSRNNKINNSMKMSNLAITSNYFKYLMNGLESSSETE